MKYLKEVLPLLDALDEDARINLVQVLADDAVTKYYEDLPLPEDTASILIYLFEWHETIQGLPYWEEIYYLLCKNQPPEI